MTHRSGPACSGLVLCGGASQRMGQPKAWLQIDSKSLLENTLHHLQQAGCSTLAVAANRRQPLPDFPSQFSDTKILFDNDRYSGPLAGLQAGLECLGACGEWVVVVPCDLPRLTALCLTRLIQHALDGPKPCPTVIRQGTRVNPLLGVFPTAWHQKAAHLLERGLARADGLLQGESLRYFEVAEDDPTWRDCDTPEEWQALCRPTNHSESLGGKPV